MKSLIATKITTENEEDRDNILNNFFDELKDDNIPFKTINEAVSYFYLIYNRQV